MASSTRERIDEVIGTLSDTQLEEVLHFVETLASTGGDLEAEERWLLYSGALKRMVDEMADAPPPVDDWRSHLRGL